MAFLSSFRIGQQTVYPEELHERLKSFALLENVGDAALRNLLAEANWFALPGGTLLDRDGENNAALFLFLPSFGMRRTFFLACLVLLALLATSYACMYFKDIILCS